MLRGPQLSWLWASITCDPGWPGHLPVPWLSSPFMICFWKDLCHFFAAPRVEFSEGWAEHHQSALFFTRSTLNVGVSIPAGSARGSWV